MVEREKQVGHDTRKMQASVHSLDSRFSGTADLYEFRTLPCGMRSLFLRGQEFRQKNSAPLCEI